MRHRTLKYLLLPCLAALVACLPAACSRPPAETAAAEESAAAPAPPGAEERIETLLAAMSPEEKIGQMMMVGIHGIELSEESQYLLANLHAGSIILYDRNLTSAEQAAALTRALQAYAAGDARQKAPLLIAIDEEGGRVARGRSFLTAPPSQQSIGAAGDEGAARQWAQQTAKSLKALGINVNLAPVADVSAEDSRSYGSQSARVAGFVAAAADGYEQEGLLYTLKHFPGIGKGTVDSHLEVSLVPASLAELEQEDMQPFARIIAERAPEDYLILVSHLIYPALDEGHSASQSDAVMGGLLRERMGYKGIIITDDMEMGAVANHETYRRLGVNAVKAGADIVMICHEFEHEKDIYAGLHDAWQSGEIPEARLDASVRRILRAKLAHGA